MSPSHIAQPKTNDQVFLSLKRDYPAGQWSCSMIRTADFRAMDSHEDPEELDVTFQRYSDDAEDRYVIANGYSTQI
jgi:hypothetical protein